MHDPNTPYKPASVFIAIPCHDQRIHSRFATSLIAAIEYLDMQKIPHCHAFGVQSGICVSRDMLTTAFVDSGMDTMFFMDTDLEAELKVFQRILHCPYHLAGGVYCKKSLDLKRLRADQHKDGSDEDWVARNMNYAWNANQQPTKCNPDGFMPVRSLPTGYMKVRRCVIDEICRQHPELQYEDDKGKLCYALFLDTMYDDPYRKKRVRFSEDFSFCHKAAAAGFQPYADLESTFKHIGIFEYPSNVITQCSRIPNAQLTAVPQKPETPAEAPKKPHVVEIPEPK